MKKRIDEMLVERGLAASVKEAAALVMSGDVMVNDHREDKSGTSVADDASIRVKDRSKYVSRGGDKLASVAEVLKLDFTDKIVLDVGSSTGGFTDYALRHGAIKVFAVDVGRNQLDYRLRQDPRVVVMEGTDIRALAKGPAVIDKAGVAVIDVSFTKLEKILLAVTDLLVKDGLIIAMMKPQFEADKTTADRFGGVISDEAVRQEIIDDFRAKILVQFEIVAESDSMVYGSKGNRERFFVLRPK
jgi:23S rRNA (cytidine1920-2'-O)/16S rRNA (cytidine1409-2'-O)-methyltransferase